MNQPKAATPASTERSLAFRRALGTFLTGVTIVTTGDEQGRPRGITANSFTSVSLEPPLVLVCIARSAESYQAFVNGGGFSINILADSQRPLSQLFASKSAEKFDAVCWHRGGNGAPVLADSLAWFDCRTVERTEAGDHVVLIGEVTNFDASQGRPLGYCQGNYVSFDLIQNAVGQAAGTRVHFGCIINDGARVLLCRSDAQAPWSLPMSSLGRGSGGDQNALLALLRDAGIEAELSFLYSMFEMPETGETHIVYRGRLRSLAGPHIVAEFRHELFPFDRIPWDRLASPQLATMLRRYVREQAGDSFGIYVDGAGDGRVARLSGAPEPWRPEPAANS